MPSSRICCVPTAGLCLLPNWFNRSHSLFLLLQALRITAIACAQHLLDCYLWKVASRQETTRGKLANFTREMLLASRLPSTDTDPDVIASHAGKPQHSGIDSFLAEDTREGLLAVMLTTVEWSQSFVIDEMVLPLLSSQDPDAEVRSSHMLLGLSALGCLLRVEGPVSSSSQVDSGCVDPLLLLPTVPALRSISTALERFDHRDASLLHPPGLFRALLQRLNVQIVMLGDRPMLLEPEQLCQLSQSVHRIVSMTTGTVQSDAIPAAQALFCRAVQCLPAVWPADPYESQTLVHLLCDNVEAALRQGESNPICRVLKTLMHGDVHFVANSGADADAVEDHGALLTVMRGAILTSMCRLCVSMVHRRQVDMLLLQQSQQSSTEASTLTRTFDLTHVLLQLWLKRPHRLGALGQSKFVDLSEIDATALLLLCEPEAELRRLALSVIDLTQRLRRELELRPRERSVFELMSLHRPALYRQSQQLCRLAWLEQRPHSDALTSTTNRWQCPEQSAGDAQALLPPPEQCMVGDLNTESIDDPHHALHPWLQALHSDFPADFDGELLTPWTLSIAQLLHMLQLNTPQIEEKDCESSPASLDTLQSTQLHLETLFETPLRSLWPFLCRKQSWQLSESLFQKRTPPLNPQHWCRYLLYLCSRSIGLEHASVQHTLLQVLAHPHAQFRRLAALVSFLLLWAAPSQSSPFLTHSPACRH